MFNSFLSIISEKIAREELIFLTSDCGTIEFLKVQECYPERCMNIGIAENTLVTAAAGLAAAGVRPVAYSIAAFLVSRSFEQIRNDIVLQKLPVILVGGGAGLSYPTMGPTHHALEDIALLRMLDGLSIIVPSVSAQIRPALDSMLEMDTPVYLRLGWEKPMPPRYNPHFVFGHGNIVREGTRVALFCTGPALHLAIEVQALLSKSVEWWPWIVEFPTLVPFDQELCLSIAQSVELVVTIEEHSVTGGLGDLVCRAICGLPSAPGLERIGTSFHMNYYHGTREELYRHFGMSPEAVCERIKGAL